MIRRRSFSLLLLLVAMVAFPQSTPATGWNDYTLVIAPGYEIWKCNTFDISLTDGSGMVIYGPEEGGKSGPITGYIVAPKHIFLRSAGQTPRNSFEGDTYVCADLSVEYFFIVDRATNVLSGPLSLSEFTADGNVTSLGAIAWTVPTNPHPERARAGQIMFLAFAAMIYGVPLLLVVLIVFVIAGAVGRPKESGATLDP